MVTLFTSVLVLAAAPATPLLRLPENVRELSAPLGRLGTVVEGLPPGGMSASDKPVLPHIAGCEPQQVVYLMRMLGGTARAVEQLQQWLDATAGVEAKLFKRKGVLGEVVRHLGEAKFDAVHSCTPLRPRDGFALELDWALPKYCALDEQPNATGLGDYWFFTKSKAAAVVNVASGAEADACKLRVSAVLFDPFGKARVRLHADWGGEAMVSLVGDGCQVVDFVLRKETQTFAPAVRSCKR